MKRFVPSLLYFLAGIIGVVLVRLGEPATAAPVVGFVLFIGGTLCGLIRWPTEEEVAQ